MPIRINCKRLILNGLWMTPLAPSNAQLRFHPDYIASFNAPTLHSRGHFTWGRQ